MPGPAPKNPAQRRRQNAAPPTTKIDPAAKVKAPPLPPGMGERAAELWAELWSDAVAVVWETCDRSAVARLCRFRAAEESGEAGGVMLAQITALEDRLGLSPMARRRLQYEIDKAAGATASAPAAPMHDDRFLRVVS
jgi:hypothetical protein